LDIQFSKGGGYFNIRTSTKKRRNKATAYSLFDDNDVAFMLHRKTETITVAIRIPLCISMTSDINWSKSLKEEGRWLYSEWAFFRISIRRSPRQS